MAAPLKRLSISSLNCTPRLRPRPRISRLRPCCRALSNSVPRRADKDKPPDNENSVQDSLPSSDVNNSIKTSSKDIHALEAQANNNEEGSVREEVNEVSEELGQDSETQIKEHDFDAAGPKTTPSDLSEGSESKNETQLEPGPDFMPDSSKNEPATNSLLMKLLGVNPFRQAKPLPPEANPMIDPDHQVSNERLAASFKYGEFGDDFDHLKPPKPADEADAYTDAVRELKEAMEQNVQDSKITELLQNVQMTQKALAEANKEWAEKFGSAVSENVDQHWEEAIANTQEEWDEYQNELKQVEKDLLTRDPEPAGYWNMGEENEGIGEDEEFRNDDLTPLGHAELEQHREIREYARIAAWEMPLLSKLAKPFVVPKAATPLRFRYTTYMGEQHPAARKVVLDFSPSDLSDLTPKQREKLIKIAGVRYNPSTNRIKMSCESFEHPAQNKRYLSDVVDSLIVEAKDGKDSFEDVPFDFRHHKPKPVFTFPESWKITPERQAFLEARRKSAKQNDESGLTDRSFVDGVKVIEQATRTTPTQNKVPEMVAVGASKKGGRPRRDLV